ncbi:hypothetical protein [Pararhizobium mangrovi]|uniref:Lipoprotein n=1 Tax=Pararhizobium mangrovi TaxID=2590452 RepID=A0A506UAJ8_9HYPH|nr:hypothetical protein [Pararhizobium mangrovi]TPW30396.1 hypothetical protein FJU11_05145 [Pararhizobium mangrovi]
MAPKKAHTFPAAHSEPASEDVSASRSPTQTAPADQGSVRFTPVIGAPEDAIRPLSSELEAAAKRRGLAIRNHAGEPVDSILRGYFDASEDGGTTRIEYVWDVLDENGNRLHRIQGDEVVPDESGSAWGAGHAEAMRTIARKTIADYLAWRQHGSG